MTANPPPTKVIRLEGLSNCEFLERFARPGCIGLSGGVTLIDRAIEAPDMPLGQIDMLWDADRAELDTFAYGAPIDA